MQSRPTDPTRPYAPLPVTDGGRSDVPVGMWFAKNERAIHAIVIATALVAGNYFVWRFFVSGMAVPRWLFWTMISAEVFGLLNWAILAHDAWTVKKTPRPKPLDASVDILIPTYNEGMDVVEPTVLGAKNIRGNTTVWLLDDGNRPAMQRMAHELGVHYLAREDNTHAKAGNINAALPHLKSDFILVLDADHVASPDFLEATLGYFANDDIALVQTAHSFRNHNSITHYNNDGRNEQSIFFDVLLPGRNRVGSVFWCGSAALIRRHALNEVGGVATQTVVEDFETSSAMRTRGWQSVYHNEHLVQGLAPHDLASHLIQRSRWAQGTLSMFSPKHNLLLKKNLNLGERTSFLGSLLYYLTPLQRLAYATVAVSVLIFGLIPIRSEPGDFTQYWLPWALLSILSVAALSRGASRPSEGLANTWITAEVYLRALPKLFKSGHTSFRVTPKEGVDLGGWDAVKLLRLPLAVAMVLTAAIAARLIDSVIDLGIPDVDSRAIAISAGFAGYEAFVIWQTVIAAYRRKQFRTRWRFPVRMQATVDGLEGQCLDLHEAGASVLVPANHAWNYEDDVPLTLTVRDIHGQPTHAEGLLTVRSIRAVQDAQATVRLSGPITWNNSHSRRAVLTHCYVVEPFEARQHRTFARAPRFPVNLAATVENMKATCLDLSAAGGSFDVPHHTAAADQTLTIRVDLNDDTTVVGSLTVRSIRDERIGGTIAWYDDLPTVYDFLGIHGGPK